MSDLIPRYREWTSARRSGQGTAETSAGDARYLYVPIVLGDRVRGTFVVLNFTEGERAEVDDSVRVAAGVSLSVLLLASLVAWVAAGRVLAPLRELKSTAQGITETDLTRRIEVQGHDELADLGRTFNAMLDRVESAFSSQKQFINDASHELRTPITIIRGHLELIGEDPAERRDTVALVMDELDRMTRFVDDLLLLARAERADFLSFDTVDLHDLGHELDAKARGLADRDWRLDADAHGELLGDRQRLTQAVMNLAGNAVQHTHPGDRITIGMASAGGWARLWVADDGPGIAPEDQARVFERFARGSERRRASEGAGLGLAIVRAIAEAHGGYVELDSVPAEGSTFTLVVPMHAPRISTFPRPQPQGVPS